MSRMVHEFSSPVERESGTAYMLTKAKDLPEGRVRRSEGGALLVYEGADATIRVAEPEVPAEPHALVTALTAAG